MCWESCWILLVAESMLDEDDVMLLRTFCARTTARNLLITPTRKPHATSWGRYATLSRHLLIIHARHQAIHTQLVEVGTQFTPSRSHCVQHGITSNTLSYATLSRTTSCNNWSCQHAIRHNTITRIHIANRNTSTQLNTWSRQHAIDVTSWESCTSSLHLLTINTTCALRCWTWSRQR